MATKLVFGFNGQAAVLMPQPTKIAALGIRMR